MRLNLMNLKVPPVFRLIMNIIVIAGLVVVDVISLVTYYLNHSVDAYIEGLQAYTQSQFVDSFRNLHLVNNYFWFSYLSELDDLQWKEFESSFRISIEEQAKAENCPGTTGAVKAFIDYFPNASSVSISTLHQVVIDCYFQQAKKSIEAGNFTAAIENYQAVILEYPETPAADQSQEEIADVYLQLAENAWENADRDGALVYLQTVVDHYSFLPQSTQAATRMMEMHVLIGDDARARRDYAEAIRQYQYVLDLAGGSSLANDLFGKISKSYLEWARLARSQKDFTLSEELYTTLLQEWSDSSLTVVGGDEFIQTNLEHAAYALENQDGATAIRIYRTVSTEYPNTPYAQQAAEALPDAYLQYADQLVASKDFLGAVENYTNLTLNYPGTTYAEAASQQIDPAYLAYAADLLQQGDYTASYQAYDTLSRMSSNEDIRSQAAEGYQQAVTALAQDTSGQGKALMELALGQACSLKPTTSPALSLFNDSPAQGLACTADYTLPSDLVASQPGSLRYVVIFEEGTDLLQTCTFSGVFKIYRERYWWKFNIVEVTTGKVVATETFYGSNPKVCPRKAFYTVGQNEKTYLGDKPDQDQTDQWLRDWFER